MYWGVLFLEGFFQALFARYNTIDSFNNKCEWKLSAFHAFVESIYCVPIVVLMNLLLCKFNRKVVKD